jgi:hypothetical protein
MRPPGRRCVRSLRRTGGHRGLHGIRREITEPSGRAPEGEAAALQPLEGSDCQCGVAARQRRQKGTARGCEHRRHRTTISLPCCAGSGVRRQQDNTMRSEGKRILRRRRRRRLPRPSPVQGPPVEFTGLPVVSCPRQFLEPVLQLAASRSRRTPPAAANRQQPLPQEAVSGFCREFCGPPRVAKLRSASLATSPSVRPLQRTKNSSTRSPSRRTPPRRARPASFHCTTEDGHPAAPPEVPQKRNPK